MRVDINNTEFPFLYVNKAPDKKSTIFLDNAIKMMIKLRIVIFSTIGKQIVYPEKIL